MIIILTGGSHDKDKNEARSSLVYRWAENLPFIITVRKASVGATTLPRMPLLYYTQYTLHNTILRTIRKVQAPEKACRSETHFAKEEHSVAKTKKTYIYIYIRNDIIIK